MNLKSTKSLGLAAKLSFSVLASLFLVAAGDRAFAADLSLRAGFAVTPNPYTEAVTIVGRARSTPTTTPVGNFFINFSNYLTCTLRNPSSISNTPDSVGNIATVVGTASCNNLGSAPFSVAATIVLRFSANGGFRDGSLKLVSVDNGEVATINLLRSKPLVSFVP